MKNNECNKNFNKLLIEHRADPHIFKHTDGYYYFTATEPDYGYIGLRRSKTINGLKEEKDTIIWRKHDKGPMSEYIWAPEIHFVNGAWYIYFAAGTTGIDKDFQIRPYVLECTDSNPLEGNWVEKGQINIAYDSFALDATTFIHNDTQYLIWAQTIGETKSNLYISRMSNPWTIETEPVLLSKSDYPWESIGFTVNEGPYIVVKNDTINLTYSASATDSNYCVGLLTANINSDLLDAKSWTKSPVPVLATDDDLGIYGPGHNCFTVAEDGETTVLVYHARTYKTIEGDPLNNPDRHTFIKNVKWSSDDTVILK